MMPGPNSMTKRSAVKIAPPVRKVMYLKTFSTPIWSLKLTSSYSIQLSERHLPSPPAARPDLWPHALPVALGNQRLDDRRHARAQRALDHYHVAAAHRVRHRRDNSVRRRRPGPAARLRQCLEETLHVGATGKDQIDLGRVNRLVEGRVQRARLLAELQHVA